MKLFLFTLKSTFTNTKNLKFTLIVLPLFILGCGSTTSFSSYGKAAKACKEWEKSNGNYTNYNNGSERFEKLWLNSKRPAYFCKEDYWGKEIKAIKYNDYSNGRVQKTFKYKNKKNIDPSTGLEICTLWKRVYCVKK